MLPEKLSCECPNSFRFCLISLFVRMLLGHIIQVKFCDQHDPNPLWSTWSKSLPESLPAQPNFRCFSEPIVSDFFVGGFWMSQFHNDEDLECTDFHVPIAKLFGIINQMRIGKINSVQPTHRPPFGLTMPLDAFWTRPKTKMHNKKLKAQKTSDKCISSSACISCTRYILVVLYPTPPGANY